MKRSKKLGKWLMIISFTIASSLPFLSKRITLVAICQTFLCFALIFIWYDWCLE